MDEERDFVTFADDEGNEFELDIIDYFEYEDEVYAVLEDLSASDDNECTDEECTHDHEHDVYIMRVVENGDMQEFLPADEDKMEELIAVVEQLWSEEGCDCEEECDGCDCEH